MNRRTALRTATAAALGSLAGCVSGRLQPTTTEPTPTPTDTPTETTTRPTVSVTAADAAPEDSRHRLQVAWNARTQDSITPPDRDVRTHAEDGRMWLVVRMAVRNTGDEAWEARATPFVARTPDAEYEIVGFRSQYLGGTTIDPGQTVSRWIAFHLPLSVRDVTLTVEQDNAVTPLAVDFSADSTLEIGVPR